MAPKLRSNSKIKYVGVESVDLLGGKFPLVREVLCFFFYQHRTLKYNIRRSARNAVRKASANFWRKTCIPMQQEIKSIEKLENLHAQWRSLFKNKSRSNQNQVLKFQSNLDLIFDLSAINAISEMRSIIKTSKNASVKGALQEDISFLEDQRSLRQGVIGGQDKNLRKVQRKAEKKSARKHQLLLEAQSRPLRKPEGLLGLQTTRASFEDDDSSVDDHDDISLEAPQPVKKRGSKNVVSAELAQALDVSKVSNRNATLILAAAAKTFGANIKASNINVTSIRKKRNKARDTMAANVKETLHADEVLTVHWDGKIMNTLTGHDKVDRQAIVVTGVTTDQLLGAPALEHGTGKAIAESVLEHMLKWDVTTKVKAMCFDTTAVNTGNNQNNIIFKHSTQVLYVTGCKSGAATLIERSLGRQLLWLPCRHHIAELVLESVYHAIMGPSTGPEIKLFKQFQHQWPNIDQSDYGISKAYPSILSGARRSEIISFAKSKIATGQPRDDYLELLELTIIFLGGTAAESVRFRQPGPMHAARWMSKAIYSIKVWLFRKQLTLSRKETSGLFDVCIFVASAYIEVWFSATHPALAPKLDLQLISRLNELKSVNMAAANRAEKKFSLHMWYLCEELVGLAIFDESLPNTERQNLAHAIQVTPGIKQTDVRKRNAPLKDLLNISISQLGSKNTLTFFEKLGINVSFLRAPVSTWNTNAAYIHGRAIVHNLKVVNDHAERAIRQIQDYNGNITQNEAGFQNLLVNINHHKKNIPDMKKSTIVAHYSS